MAKKKTAEAEPKKPRKMTYEELEAAACELGARVLWALKFCTAKGGGMVMMTVPEKQTDGTLKFKGNLKVQGWQDYFMDALDMVGHRIDREAFYARRKKSPKGRSQRKH